ncbi:MAG TPA: class I SAM-dependent methyltransferase [Steroidobacteraceae bacterium]
MPSSEDHWTAIYRKHRASELSWFQAEPTCSLALIEAAGLARSDPILDVGGGASLLVDHLLDRGYQDITVLDLAAPALDAVRARLGPRDQAVTLLHADLAGFVPKRRYGLWHDRAVFHFLTSVEDRRSYLRALDASLHPGGHVVIATFAPDGPARCSGLDVVCYEPSALAATLGPQFALLRVQRELHVTPTGVVQPFQYSLFRAAV